MMVEEPSSARASLLVRYSPRNPFGHAAHSFFVALGYGRAVAAEHTGEVEAVDHFLERGQLGIDGRLIGIGTRGDPAIQDKVERTALGDDV